MIHADARRQGNTPALAPQRMTRAPLNEGIGLAGVIAGRRDRQRIQPPLFDRAPNTHERQLARQQSAQRRGVEQRLNTPGAQQRPQGRVAQQAACIACQGTQVGAIDLGCGEVGPQPGQCFGGLVKALAPGGEGRAVDRPGRCTGDDVEWRRPVTQAGYLPDPLEHAGLIGPARAAGGQCQGVEIGRRGRVAHDARAHRRRPATRRSGA